MSMYSIEKNTIFGMAEEYLGYEQIELDEEELEEIEDNTSDIHSIAMALFEDLRILHSYLRKIANMKSDSDLQLVTKMFS